MKLYLNKVVQKRKALFFYLCNAFPISSIFFPVHHVCVSGRPSFSSSSHTYTQALPCVWWSLVDLLWAVLCRLLYLLLNCFVGPFLGFPRAHIRLWHILTKHFTWFAMAHGMKGKNVAWFMILSLWPYFSHHDPTKPRFTFGIQNHTSFSYSNVHFPTSLLLALFLTSNCQNFTHSAQKLPPTYNLQLHTSAMQPFKNYTLPCILISCMCACLSTVTIE